MQYYFRIKLFSFIFFIQQCAVINSTRMMCPMPVLSFPTVLLPWLNARPYTPLPGYGSEAENDALPRDLETSHCPQFLNSYVLSSWSEIKFHAGFQLDGFTGHSDFGLVNVFPLPTICTNDTLLNFTGFALVVAVNNNSTCLYNNTLHV